MEDVEIIKSFRSMKLDSRELLVLLDGIQKGTVTIQMNEDGGITVEDTKETPQKKAITDHLWGRWQKERF